MSPRFRTVLRWLPRVGGIAFALFLALFAFDVFEGEATPMERAIGLGIHLLPNFALLALVAVAWKRPWVGALGFGVLALAYVAIAREHPTWIALIAGPLVLVAAFYALAARLRA
ncbi:MAG: hypothetical protein ACKO4Q_19370 [Planctomycetota bacterium]